VLAAGEQNKHFLLHFFSPIGEEAILNGFFFYQPK